MLTCLRHAAPRLALLLALFASSCVDTQGAGVRSPDSAIKTPPVAEATPAEATAAPSPKAPVPAAPLTPQDPRAAAEAPKAAVLAADGPGSTPVAPKPETHAPAPPKQETPKPDAAKPDAPKPDAPKPKQQDDPKAVEVIEKYLQAIGGRENLALIKDRSAYYLNKKYSPTGAVETKMARFNKGEFKIREQWDFPNWGLMPGQQPLTIIQTYDGQKGYVKMMGYVDELEGKTLTMLVWDKHIDDPFLHWKQDGFIAKHKGESEVASVPVVRVDLETRGSTNKQSFYFRKDDGLLIKKDWISEDPSGGRDKKETFFSEYQKIRFADAPDRFILVPINEKIFTEGELDLERDYTEVKINSGLTDDLFGRPEGPDYEEFEKKKAEEEKAKLQKKDGAESKPGHGGATPESKPTSQPKAGK